MAFVPSKYQAAIFEAIKARESNILVKATAGSGKTTVLEHGVRYVDPSEAVAMLAFNAAIAKVLGQRMPSGVSTSTFHSFAWRSYLRFCPGAQMYKGKNANAGPRAKMGDIAKSVLDYSMRSEMGALISLVGKAKVHGIVPDIAAGRTPFVAKGLMPDTDENWLGLAVRYGIEMPAMPATHLRLAREMLTRDLVDAKNLDFDDQLYFPVVYGANFPKFDTVMVDEAQDTNDIQIEIILRMGDEKTRYVIVGDESQSLYRFRGADANAMKRIGDALKCKVMPLSITYRCGKNIVKEAQKYDPTIEAADGAEDGVVARRSDFAKVKVGDLIVCRTNAQLMKAAYNLLSRNIPVRIQGRDFLSQILGRIKKLKCDNVEDVIPKLCAQVAAAIERLEEDDDEAYEALVDQRDCIITVVGSSKAESMEELEQHLETLFDTTEPHVLLSSIHRAKGGEAKVVWVIDHEVLMRVLYGVFTQRVKQGKMTQEDMDLSMQQERNCCFVAVTRAMSELYFVDMVQ